MRNKDIQRLVRNVEAHGDEFTKPCLCGCGEPVSFTHTGIKNYVNISHFQWTRNYSELGKKRRETDLADAIPIEDFRAAVLKLKHEKGWTWKEMAERGGQQLGWLNNYMFRKDRTRIGRKTAVSFLRRLAGLPEPASVHQQRIAKKHVQRVERAIRDIGMDATPPKLDTRSFVDYAKRDGRKK